METICNRNTWAGARGRVEKNSLRRIKEDFYFPKRTSKVINREKKNVFFETSVWSSEEK